MTAIMAGLKAFFGELFSDVKLLLIFLLAAGLMFFALQAGRQARLNDGLKAELAASQAEAAGLSKELKLNWQALERREAERNRLAAENEALAAKLKEVYANDESAKAWADSPCPDSVLDCLFK